MSSIFLNKNIYQKETFFFFIFYLTLITSFFLGENSTGGALLDYINQKKISQTFSQNFFYTLLNYDEFTTRHSPVLIIFFVSSAHAPASESAV